MKKFKPDLKMAVKFIRAFHGDNNFWLQTFDDSDRNRGFLVTLEFGPIDKLLSKAVVLNKQGAGVFIAPNRISDKRRTSREALGVNAVWADCDTPNTPWPDLGPKPHIVVESSPGKYHLYWLIKGCPLNEFKPIQKCIARMYKSDPKVCDLARVMRLPGFYHHKEEPFMTIIFKWNIDD